MALEEQLFNYGILGIWTIYNLLTIRSMDQRASERELRIQAVIEANTQAMQRCADQLQSCPLKR